jgi:alanyl-tRNA synthetase
VSLAERDVAEIQKLEEQAVSLGGRRDAEAIAAATVLADTKRSADAAVAQLGPRGASVVLRDLRTQLETLERDLGARLEMLRTEVASLRKAQSAGRARRARDRDGEARSRCDRRRRTGAGSWRRSGSEAEANAVRDAADTLRASLERGAAVLALRNGDKLTFVAAVTDDLVAEKKLNASDLVKKVAQVAGGSGGGKPHLALAGGKDPAQLDAALDEARRLLREALA